MPAMRAKGSDVASFTCLPQIHIKNAPPIATNTAKRGRSAQFTSSRLPNKNPRTFACCCVSWVKVNNPKHNSMAAMTDNVASLGRRLSFIKTSAATTSMLTKMIPMSAGKLSHAAIATPSNAPCASVSAKKPSVATALNSQAVQIIKPIMRLQSKQVR